MTRHQRITRRRIWWVSAITGALFCAITLFGPAIGGLITQ
ncbi:Uncharacterized protein AC504_2437 [Pseudomonas syringae pv. maculicola]|nr:Uncharacterized protein AC504_2437 [Pseudomonas syringae pv. maculicola]